VRNFPMKLVSKAIKTQVEATFVGQNLQKSENNPVFVLLHGYGESGPTLFRRIKGQFSTEATILAPNGPLMIPHPTEGELTLKYAWYFFDPKNPRYLTDPKYSLFYLLELLEDLELIDRDIHIIGYSQGGYMAPYLGRHLKNCLQVLGINCRFKNPFIGDEMPFLINAIHGKEDEVVDFEESRKTFHDLKNKYGVEGEFYGVEKEGHLLSLEIRNKIKEVLFPNTIDQ
jgi:predicted esterase